VLGNFMGEPFYSELRTRQQLGYIVAANAGNEESTHFAYFIVQSGEYPADEVEKRADDFIVKLPLMLGNLPAEAWDTIVGGVRAELEEKDKAVADRAKRLFSLAYDRGGDWGRREETLAALDRLTKERTGEILDHALGLSTRQMRTFLGFARQHESKSAPATSFTDRPAWKGKRDYK
ncbi:MAG TPA: hypothetical protein VHN79_05935, partial [Lacunisphaera sp.]|nr:hypothetical protein [Lacunisphaera sp.]